MLKGNKSWKSCSERGRKEKNGEIEKENKREGERRPGARGERTRKRISSDKTQRMRRAREEGSRRRDINVNTRE